MSTMCMRTVVLVVVEALASRHGLADVPDLARTSAFPKTVNEAILGWVIDLFARHSNSIENMSSNTSIPV